MAQAIIVREVVAADLTAITSMFQRMDVAELGAVITEESEVGVELAEADVGAWVATTSEAVAAFGSLRRRPWGDELRAHLSFAPGADAAVSVILDRIAEEGVRVGATAITLWQLADGIASVHLREHGWEPVYTYARLALGLVGRQQPKIAPAVVVDAASDVAGRKLVHEVIDDAVTGHWDHRHLSFEQFDEAQAAREGHDPALWYLAWVDDEPAGGVIARTPGQSGLIAWLGTLERFRGRGVATALLTAVFAELDKRRMPRVYVDVDPANATNAMAVYERVGMRQQFRMTQWRLAGGVLGDQEI
ncbi:MAG TPA: GNAT family N-acetyltransferase [Solirubrobacteraceae bacterium]|nr:GNAT family N-acetyltransferase [Solirubrobacteraceae bacterium]